MKSNLLTGISCITAALVLLYACQKQLSPSAGATPALSASTTNAATGEKISLTVTNAPAGTHFIWASTQVNNASFSITGQGDASVSFSKPGTYKVTCYIVDGEGQDSIPATDTSYHPYDTIPVYPPPPPPPPPVDTTGYGHDTVPSYPHDTVPGYPYDTTPGYPHDTTPGYPHDTTPSYPHDTVPVYPPHDTVPSYPPHDSTYYHDSTYIDSAAQAHNGHVVKTVSITIIVR